MPSRGLLANSIFGSIAGIVPLAGGFFTSVVVARTLGIQGTGVTAYFSWLIATVITVTNLGIPSILTRFLPEFSVENRPDLARQFVSSSLRVYALAISITAIIIIPIGVGVAQLQNGRSEPERHIVWVAALVWYILQAYSSFYFAYLSGTQRFDRAAIIATVSSALQLLATTCGSLWFGVAGAVAGYAMAGLIPSLYCLGLRRKTTSLPSGLVKRLRKSARYFWLIYIVEIFVWGRIELFFLSIFVDRKAVGAYAVGLSLATLVTQIPAYFSGALMPFFTERFAARQLDSIRSAYASSTIILALIAFPAAFGAAAVAPVLITSIYGSEFSIAVPAAIILMGCAAVAAISTAGSSLVYGTEGGGFMLSISLLGAVLMLGAGVTIIPWFGLVGAASARLVTQSILTGAVMWHVASRGRSLPAKNMGLIALSALLCAIAAHLAVSFIKMPFSLPAAIATGVIVYCVAIRALRALPRLESIRLYRALQGTSIYIRAPGMFMVRLLTGVVP